MTLAAIITKLATAGALISGVKKSFDLTDMPPSLQPAHLPALLYFPDGGGASVLEFGGAELVAHRIRIQVAYASASQGQFGKNVSGVVGIMDGIISSLRTDNTLGGSCWNARVKDYTRIGEFTIGGIDYFGIEIVVEATEYLG